MYNRYRKYGQQQQKDLCVVVPPGGFIDIVKCNTLPQWQTQWPGAVVP